MEDFEPHTGQNSKPIVPKVPKVSEIIGDIAFLEEQLKFSPNSKMVVYWRQRLRELNDLLSTFFLN